MSQNLYSVEQVAELLGLHVKTVRNYVREGRLKAVRIGKSYRIAREDLEALTGRSGASLDREPVPRQRHVDVSSIVEIDVISPDMAIRLTNMLTSAPKGRPEGDQALHVETVYNEERARLKVILMGSLTTVSSFLQFIGVYLENQQ
ncbi:MAG: helix-turn-helix domain-containing protein [Acidobacteriia bacterium]|nr:helix-turn-helix domain-containing protein [Terriglobia bacterium]